MENQGTPNTALAELDRLLGDFEPETIAGYLRDLWRSHLLNSDGYSPRDLCGIFDMIEAIKRIITARAKETARGH